MEEPRDWLASVTVRGKVVKFNGGILGSTGRIRDGSGVLAAALTIDGDLRPA